MSSSFFSGVAEIFRRTLEEQRDSYYCKGNLAIGGNFSSEIQINDVRSRCKIVVRSRAYRVMREGEAQAGLDLQLLRYPASEAGADLLANYTFIASKLDSNESSGVVLDTVREEAVDTENYHVLLEHALQLICSNVSCLAEALCGVAPLIDIQFDV